MSSTEATHRNSGMATDSEAMNPDESHGGVEESPLDRTIEKIGMGYYQWSLLWLCGFGWMADNMWLEAIAVALPRVQDHFSVPNQNIGWLSTSMFGGMMFGAVGWGNSSDVFGRRFAFNATLVLSAIFGLLVSLAPTFVLLCLSLTLLGTAVGGSIPTDGTLFLENIPRRKQYLLTMLSIFFSVGGVLAAIVGIWVIPSNSCPEAAPGSTERPPCDVAIQNKGWKYLFFVLTAFTALMFVCRIFLFQLYESPRYLVHAGRRQEALQALQQIIKTNGLSLNLDVDDVRDNIPPFNPSETDRSVDTSSSGSSTPSRYLATEGHTPKHQNGQVSLLHRFLPSGAAAPLLAWLEKSRELLTPQWKRTTLLMWGAWMFTSLAYTMFNVYFPKLIELRLGGDAVDGSRKQAMWDVVVFTLGGTPGAIIGAAMVETRLGRRNSLAVSTGATAVLCVLFTRVSSHSGVIFISMGISLTTTMMWAILYGMTPEMFVTEVRGTACGNASALNRVSGMIAPLLGGILLNIDVSFPVYGSALTFFLGAACAFALPYESAAGIERSEKRSASYSLLH